MSWNKECNDLKRITDNQSRAATQAGFTSEFLKASGN